MAKQVLTVTGMHCQSCVNLITKSLSKEKGVKFVNVNFSTEKANIKFDPNIIDENKLLKLIKKKGYKPYLIEESSFQKEEFIEQLRDYIEANRLETHRKEAQKKYSLMIY